MLFNSTEFAVHISLTYARTRANGIFKRTVNSDLVALAIELKYIQEK